MRIFSKYPYLSAATAALTPNFTSLYMTHKLLHPLLITIFCLLVNFSFGQLFGRPAMPDEKMTFRPQIETEGIITGSITFPDTTAEFSLYGFYVSAISDDKKTSRKNSGEFYVKPDVYLKYRHEGQADQGRTYVFALKKPEGKYMINSVRLVTMGFGTSRSDALTGFEIPIDVKKGEITYVGNIIFNENAASGEKIISLGDTYTRDLKILQLLQPYVVWKMAVNNPNKEIIYKDF